MKISIGSDHGGIYLKKSLIGFMKKLDIEVIDRGTNSEESVDYPLFAEKVSVDVKDKNADYGILICKTGIGMSISANKISGIRAALVYSPKTGKLAREHNNANVLCFGAGYIDFDSAKLAVKEFLSAEFEGNKPGGERHCRRIEEITSLEKKYRNNNQEE